MWPRKLNLLIWINENKTNLVRPRTPKVVIIPLILIIKLNHLYRSHNMALYHIPTHFPVVNKHRILLLFFWVWRHIWGRLYTEKTRFPFAFKFNGIWSWWQYSLRFWTKWKSIWFKIERNTVTTIYRFENEQNSVWSPNKIKITNKIITG